MLLWTIQTYDTWHRLKQDTTITVDKKYFDDHYLQPYNWMANKMDERLDSKPKNAIYPIWAWHQYNGVKKKKPDLREAGYAERGTPLVRIEIEKKADAVLLSDFDLWHYVLNYWYLPVSKNDDLAFELELKKHGEILSSTKRAKNEFIHKKIVSSWDRIFDLDWEDPIITGYNEDKCIQATFWDLNLDEVTGIKKFTAK